MQIEIWSIGKANTNSLNVAIEEYLKKINMWCSIRLEVLQLPKKDQSADVLRTKKLEEDLVLKRLNPQHYLILLDEKGKLLDSLQWAQQFQAMMNQGQKQVVVLIGGAFGVSDAVKQRANQTWSLSKLVFPHQLVRLLVAEQIYRSYSILNNLPYHHV